MKNIQEIGTVKVSYKQDGSPFQAIFTASPYNITDQSVFEQLLSVPNDSQEQIQKNAELVLAAYFNKLDEIQVLDREQYTITSEVVLCGKYYDGKIADCEIKFYLSKF